MQHQQTASEGDSPGSSKLGRASGAIKAELKKSADRSLFGGKARLTGFPMAQVENAHSSCAQRPTQGAELDGATGCWFIYLQQGRIHDTELPVGSGY